MSAQRNCFMLRSVVPRMRRKASIWVVSTARTNSPRAAQFMYLLSKVDGVTTVAVSLRHSKAADDHHQREGREGHGLRRPERCRSGTCRAG